MCVVLLSSVRFSPWVRLLFVRPISDGRRNRNGTKLNSNTVGTGRQPTNQPTPTNTHRRTRHRTLAYYPIGDYVRGLYDSPPPIARRTHAQRRTGDWRTSRTVAQVNLDRCRTPHTAILPSPSSPPHVPLPLILVSPFVFIDRCRHLPSHFSSASAPPSHSRLLFCATHWGCTRGGQSCQQQTSDTTTATTTT